MYPLLPLRSLTANIKDPETSQINYIPYTKPPDLVLHREGDFDNAHSRYPYMEDVLLGGNEHWIVYSFDGVEKTAMDVRAVLSLIYYWAESFK